MKKFIAFFTTKPMESFRKQLAVKQSTTALFTTLIILFASTSYSISLLASNVMPNAEAIIILLKIYGLCVFISLFSSIAIIALRKKDSNKYWKTIELLSKIIMSMLPFWGTLILYYSSEEEFVARIFFWAACIVGFSCASCSMPRHSTIVLLCSAILFYVANHDKLNFGEMMNCYIVQFICLWSAWTRFRHEYASFKANVDKDSYHARLTHEIRTPINAVIGTNALISHVSEDPIIKSYSEDISSASKMLLSIVNDILDLSKMESGKMKIVDEEYSLSGLIKDLEKMIRYRAENNGLEFKIDIDKNLPDKLIGDEIRVKQVIMNLLTNAVKYTDKGSVTLKVNGAVSNDDIILVFHVIDTGIGIKQEDLKMLQSEFFRIEEKRNHRVEGTGLGLNIVTMLLEAMDGKMSVISEYGVGSEFSATIPQKVVEHKAIKDLEVELKKEEKRKYFDASGTKVLVVDDNAVNCKILKELLLLSGIEVTVLASGAEMLEEVNNEKYDLIFLDHLMPKMDGIETMTKFKEMVTLNSNTPVIILTANEVENGLDYYGQYGFSDYLSKPIDIDKLEDTLENYLGPKRTLLD